MGFLFHIFASGKSADQTFQSLVHPHLDLLFRMAYHWTQNQDDAEDLVQDVLIKVVNRVDEMAAVDKLGPWLIKILYNRHVDLFRSRSRSPVDMADDVDDHGILTSEPEESLAHHEAADLQTQLNNALLQLSPVQRDIVLMHDVEGYTALEVAEIMEISVGTVKSRLHRAREKLKSILSDGTF